MPEYVRPGNWKRAAPAAMIDSAILRRDLYHLAAVFISSREMNALAFNEDLHRLPDLWNEFAEEEISIRLSSTAVLLRARDDYILRAIDEKEGTSQARADELRTGPAVPFSRMLRRIR